MPKFYPKTKMVIPEHKPYNLDQFLRLFFEEHPNNIRIQIAKALLKKIQERMPRGYPSEEWIELVLEIMTKYYPEAKALMDYYESIRWTKKKSEIPKLLEEKCFELGLVEEGEKKARGRNVALFTIYRGAYSVVVKVLRNAKLIKKIEGRYILSDEFERLLEGIAEFWHYWRLGKIEDSQ